MQRLSYPIETFLSNKTTRNRVVPAFKDSPRKPLGWRPYAFELELDGMQAARTDWNLHKTPFGLEVSEDSCCWSCKLQVNFFLNSWQSRAGFINHSYMMPCLHGVCMLLPPKKSPLLAGIALPGQHPSSMLQENERGKKASCGLCDFHQTDC